MSNGAASDALVHFFYRSVAADPHDGGMVQDILRTARRKNLERGLTGCLHVEDGMFFQWLEGPRERMAEIVALIRRDRRHHSLNVLGEGGMPARVYGDFHMRMTDRNAGSILDWLANDTTTRLGTGLAYAQSVSAFLQQARA